MLHSFSESSVLQRLVISGMVLTIAAVVATMLQCVDGASRTVLLVSDMHLDPFYGTAKGYKCTDQASAKASPYGVFGCDAPDDLVKSFLTDASTLTPYQVIFGGDWQRHHMSDLPTENYDFVMRRAATYMSNFSSASLAVPVTWAIGNNDVIPDYSLPVSPTPLFRNLASLMADASLLSIDEKAMTQVCGLYFRDVGTSLKVIVLNTLIWSTSLTPVLDDDVSDPCQQFVFFQQYLNAANMSKRRVIIVGHIPPGLNVHVALFNGLSSSSAEADVMFWKSRFQSHFTQLVTSYASVIACAIFGHGHMSSFIADAGNLPIPVFLVPSLSPMFGNNPSYLMATMDEASWLPLKLLQRVFSFSQASWANSVDYSAFVGSDLSISSLAALSDSWLAGGSTSNWTAFFSMYSSGMTTSSNIFPDGHCDSLCVRTLQCSTRFVSMIDLIACTKATAEAVSFEKSVAAATVAFTVIGTLVCLSGLVYLAVFRVEIMESLPPVLREHGHWSELQGIKTSDLDILRDGNTAEL